MTRRYRLHLEIRDETGTVTRHTVDETFDRDEAVERWPKELANFLDIRPPKRQKTERKRATGLPQGWKPTDAHASRAKQDGTDLATEAAKFVNYHGSKGSTFVDWDRAFTTWLLNAKEYRQRAKPNAPPPDSEAAQWTKEAEDWRYRRAQVEARTAEELRRLNEAGPKRIVVQ